MPTTYTFNLLEGGLWLAMAAIFAFKSLTNSAPLRRIFGVLALAFLAFGFSDFIEARTGAWWRPLWLLGLKGGCIAVFVFGFGRYFRIIKNKTQR
ncbi:MAG TPA: hypothetical protein VF627_03510 [Abditibacterium sp.]|jgi:hypothetical protein